MQPNNYQQPAMQPQQPGQFGAPNQVSPGPMMPQAPNSAMPQGSNQTTSSSTEPKKPVNKASAQNSLLFSEMRDNMVVMNDGSFRAVVECQSINFDLMSPREREGVEYSYQNFINSLHFPTQVLIRSRRVDIGPYVDRLLTIRRSQDNMLLNVLMDDYINFIEVLAQEANIMDKRFYVIIPHYPSGDLAEIKKQAKGLFDSFFGVNKSTAVTRINEATYEKAKDEIKNRVELVLSGLFQMGIKSRQLNTQQLGELFYNSYNPDISSRQSIGDIDQEALTTTYVRKGNDSERSKGFL